MTYIHTKRKSKGKKPSFQNNINSPEFVFKWVPVKGIRISPEENKKVYEEYKQVRAQLLKDTVYNPDGSENKEGISRLRQAGMTDKQIFEFVANGKTPNGYNYHHLFPRAISGSFKKGPVQFGNEVLSSIHDWRCMMPLPNTPNRDIHQNVHSAMDKRNGYFPERAGTKLTYYIAMPLSAQEYEMYKQNPKSVKEELLIVTPSSFKTVDQREKKNNKTLNPINIAAMNAAKGR